MNNREKEIILFLIGGTLYNLIEFIWKSIRGGTMHWTMFLLGGVSFLLVGLINEWIPWEMGFIWQALIGGGIVTGLEFCFGLVLNVWLGLEVWDYSHIPFNLMGQICLPFSLAWCGLAAVGIVLDDYIRYWFMGEDEPRYRWIQKI